MSNQKFKSAEKRAKLHERLKSNQAVIAERKEKERKIIKAIEETDKLYVVEITKSYNITPDELDKILENHAKLQGNPEGSTIPVQTTHAVVSADTKKSITEKEKNYDEEI